MGKPGPQPEVTAEDVLEVFESREDPGEPLTAPEIAEELNCSRKTASKRLNQLAERGDLVSKKAGGRSRVWWIPQTDTEGAPAAPLRKLVGMLNEDGADRARERSQEWREAFDEEMADGGDI